MTRIYLHVQPDADGTWSVRYTGSAGGVPCRTREEAVDTALRQAERHARQGHAAGVRVERADGTLVEEHQLDPMPSAANG